MVFVVGLLCGFAWGAVTAWVNHLLINRYQVEEETGKPPIREMLKETRIRTAVDIGSLLVVILLRDLLPFRFESVLLGTVIALGVFSIVFAYRGGKQEPAQETEREDR